MGVDFHAHFNFIKYLSISSVGWVVLFQPSILYFLRNEYYILKKPSML